MVVRSGAKAVRYFALALATAGVVHAQTPPPATSGPHADVPPLPPWPDFTAPPRYVGPPGVHVRVSSDSPGVPVTLLELTPAGWRSVCGSPCTTDVDGRDSFALGGPGLRTSPTFHLEGPTKLVATPASTQHGSIYLYVSGLLVLHGGIFFLVGESSGSRPPGPTFRAIGLLELAVAVPLLILGVYRRSSATSVVATPDTGAHAPRWLTGGLTW